MGTAIEDHLAAGRHARAFDPIVPEYRDRVFRLAWTILRHRAAAEDATQETLVRPQLIQNVRATEMEAMELLK